MLISASLIKFVPSFNLSVELVFGEFFDTGEIFAAARAAVLGLELLKLLGNLKPDKEKIKIGFIDKKQFCFVFDKTENSRRSLILKISSSIKIIFSLEI